MRPSHGEGRADAGVTMIEVLVVLVLVVIALVIAVPALVSVTYPPSNTGTQANLETALTGASIYYRADANSFSGIYGGDTEISSITGIDIALKFTHGASAKPNVISLASSAKAGWLVMAAYSRSTKICWVIDDQARPQTAAIAGNPDLAPGVYYGDILRAKSPSCAAGIALRGSRYRTLRFPHP